MESPRTKANCAWERREEKEEEPAAIAVGHPAPARTSRTCLCAENGPRAHVSPFHLPLRGLALYILPHLLLVRVSIGLAHILCESLAHPLGYFSSELTTSSEKIPQADSRPLSREDHQDLRTEKNGSFVSLPLLTLDLVYLFVFGYLALV